MKACRGRFPAAILINIHRAKLKSDIVLIVPFSQSHYIVPPVGLGYLASSLRSAGIAGVRIIDSLKDKLDLTKLPAVLKEAKPEIVGFQVFSSDVSVVQEACKMVRHELPKSTIIVGGPHISAVGESALTGFPEAEKGKMMRNSMQYIRKERNC
jgi:hypothetical protein